MKKFSKALSIAAVALFIGLLSGYFFARQPVKPFPFGAIKVERGAYDLVYDGQHKQALWVHEHLTADSVQGVSDRNKFTFKPDPQVPKALQSTNADYLGSGFDRGHLCPAADAKFSDQAMEETFYLSNISPQCPQLNRGYWLKLERHVRELARGYGSIHVFTGGLYLPHQEVDGKRYVKYQVIGENDVAVPTHYFKIVLRDDRTPLECYILPNESIAAETPLGDFMTTIEKVEKAVGIAF